MSYPGMLIEDPFYDEDGVLIDEDFDPDLEIDDEDGCGSDLMDLSPYATVNS